MRRFPLVLLVLALWLGTGCDLSSDESGPVTLMGQVLDALTNNPIEGAFVRVLPSENLNETDAILVETDAEGRFEITVEVDLTTELRLVASDDAYASSEVTVLAVAGRTVEVPNFRLRRVVEAEPESGTPTNILLMGQSQNTIGVIESGSVEVSRITFQVADSAGRPVTLDDQALVRFRLGHQPAGGEFIAPLEAPTDNNGMVTVNLSSGTKAGAVQVIAEFDRPDGSGTVRSKPVNVTIHGGLPDQAHFSLGPERYNFPGLLRFGLTNAVSVVVGDKYANPVKPGTAVYFTSSHGVIEGSLQTDAQGRGRVDLISGNPLPDDGVAIVTASTADENEGAVVGRFPVLFSGFIVLNVEPAVARLDQTYKLTLTDHKGNPLAGGTALSVRAQGTKVKAVGNTNITLDDTIFTGFTADSIVRGPGITEFTFRAVEDLNIDETGNPTLEAITIRVTGPNGAIEVVLTGDGTVQPRTAGARVEMQADGSALILADH